MLLGRLPDYYDPICVDRHATPATRTGPPKRGTA